MHFRPNLLFVFLFLLNLFSCEQVTPDHVYEIAPIRFDSLSYEKQGGLCEKPGTNCITIKLNYPKAVDGKTQVRDSINYFIEKAILDNLVAETEHSYTSIDSAANTMIDYYLEEIKEMPEYDLAWEVNIDGDAEIIDSFAVISMAAYTFLGGAHPNYYLSFLNYNLNTGKEVLLSDIITDRAAFLKLGEQKFGEARTSVYEQNDYDIDNFFWGEGYHLPANFAIKKEGLLFYYNPYEAAPYVFGPTEYLVSYKELEGLISLAR